MRSDDVTGLWRRLSRLSKARNVEAHPDPWLGLEVHDFLSRAAGSGFPDVPPSPPPAVRGPQRFRVASGDSGWTVGSGSEDDERRHVLADMVNSELADS